MSDNKSNKVPFESERSERLRREVELELELARISKEALAMATAASIPRRELARRMGSASPSTVQRIVGHGAAYNVTVETLLRFSSACGYEMRVTFVPKRSECRSGEQLKARHADCERSGLANLHFLTSVALPSNNWSFGDNLEKAG